MCDNSCCFEPTFTLNGIPILPSGCQALIAQGKAEALVAVTHLASLGVKRQEPAFWGIHKRQETDRVLNYKRKKQPFRAAFFLYGRKLHFLPYKKKRSAVDAHSRER